MSSKKKILIVDDEVDVLTLLEMRLASAGYEVLKADNGIDAVGITKEKNPDLIILDIMLPHMDGMAVSQILKEDEDTKNIPIIFLTALQDKKSENTDHKIGKNIIFAKPFDSKELLAAIKKQIG
jgi:putative two-component system response regulator